MADRAMTLRQPTEADLSRTVAELEQRLQASVAERDEALERQAATADVLQSISNSISDAKPVFDRILESTRRLINTKNVSIFLVAGEQMHSKPFGSGDQHEASNGR